MKYPQVPKDYRKNYKSIVLNALAIIGIVVFTIFVFIIIFQIGMYINY